MLSLQSHVHLVMTKYCFPLNVSYQVGVGHKYRLLMLRNHKAVEIKIHINFYKVNISFPLYMTISI